jgi:hypothetical protein
MQKHKRLWDLYRFPGFSPEHNLSGLFGDPRARVLGLIRRGKKRFVAAVAASIIPTTIEKPAEFATCLVERCGFFSKRRSVEWLAEGAGK